MGREACFHFLTMNPSIIAQAARQIAEKWHKKSAHSSGVEQDIYCEVSDAFREFAELVERLEKEEKIRAFTAWQANVKNGTYDRLVANPYPNEP